MNKVVLIVLFALSLANAVITYTVDTDRDGVSSVILSIEGSGSASVPIPPDARNFRIVGGSYSVDNQTATVVSGRTGFTTFSFATDLLTTKADSSWKLLFEPPEGVLIRAYMPAYSTIVNSFPQPKMVSSEDSRTVMEFEYAKSVSVFYRLGEPPAPVQQDSSGLFLLAAAVLVAAAAIGASMLMRQKPQTIVVETKNGEPVAVSSPPKEKEPTLEMTAGKKEMMETFNENDLRIVNYLFSVQGKSRRNELERKSGISKSSLAMALNRLEKRKIVEIDRTATTHFVKLSEYFLKL